MMTMFIKIIIFIWCFITVIVILIGARNLDKSFNTDYISDIAISLLMTFLSLKDIIFEKPNKKHKEKINYD